MSRVPPTQALPAPVAERSFKQLLEGCAKNSTLKKLECGKCGIDEKALDAIDAFCRARSSEKTLQHIGLFGNAGQAVYAAANSWLDALCRCRRSGGLCAQSTQWSYVAEVGMAARRELGEIEKRYRACQAKAKRGHEALEQALQRLKGRHCRMRVVIRPVMVAILGALDCSRRHPVEVHRAARH